MRSEESRFRPALFKSIHFVSILICSFKIFGKCNCKLERWINEIVHVGLSSSMCERLFVTCKVALLLRNLDRRQQPFNGYERLFGSFKIMFQFFYIGLVSCVATACIGVLSFTDICSLYASNILGEVTGIWKSWEIWLRAS